MTVLIIAMIVVGWFASGFLWAPRAAAIHYQYGMWEDWDGGDEFGHNLKMDSARVGWWVATLAGPLSMLYWFLNLKVSRPIRDAVNGTGRNSIEGGLIRYCDPYKVRYAEELQVKIDKLEKDNERLTRQVLDA